jgi:hypothetical protein
MILGESIYRGLSVGYSNFTSLIIQNKIVVIYYIFLVKYFFYVFKCGLPINIYCQKYNRVILILKTLILYTSGFFIWIKFKF